MPVGRFLDSRSTETVGSRLRGFRQGLGEDGYAEGRNVVIEYRGRKSAGRIVTGQFDSQHSEPASRHSLLSASSAGYLRDDEILTCLIGHIYDAALDPALWTSVLARIGEFVGGQAGGILSKDSVSKASTPYYHFGVDTYYVRIYSETHSKFDPVSTLPFFDIEQIVSLPELVPYDEFCEGRFFHEWMRPQGLVDAANSVLEKSALSCSFLTILRDEARGIVDDEMRRCMALIVPHVRRAVLISKVIDLKQAEAATFADMLDGLSAGMFLVAAEGRIVHANAAGHGMLSAGDVLRSIYGRLVTSDKQVEKVLHETLAAANHGDAEIGSKGIALSLSAQNGERYVAHVLPLTAGARRFAGVAYAATAAIFVRKAAFEGPSVPEIIARTYNLTPTELRVLLAIVEVGGIPEVATALGVADSTIKTHVGRLFGKTGASRQADLVKLVAGFSTPLAV
jgi:DNA-binding CsgD family transcriptional regulator